MGAILENGFAYYYCAATHCFPIGNILFPNRKPPGLFQPVPPHSTVRSNRMAASLPFMQKSLPVRPRRE